MMAALLAMAMVACGEKDNAEENNNNNNNGNTTDSENMVKVGTLSSNLESRIEFDEFGYANIQGAYRNNDKHIHFGAGIAWESMGKTIDLANPQTDESYWFRFEAIENENMTSFTQNNNYGTVSSYLGDGERSSQPVFSNGTLTTTKTDAGYTLSLEGTLTDGTSVIIRLTMVYTNEIIPLTPNSIIYDGVKYTLSTNASQQGNGVFNWSSNGTNVTASGEIYPNSNNLHADLTLYPTGDDYHFSFNITIPDLQLNYEWNDDQLICTLNGEGQPQTPFTDGYAETSAYYNDLSFIVIGTLSNGKTIKLYVQSTY